MIPSLEHHSGSWIITCRKTGKAVMETFRRDTARSINQSRYKVETAAEYLARVNQHIKENKP